MLWILFATENMLDQRREQERGLRNQIFLTKAAYRDTRCRQWKQSRTKKIGWFSRTEQDQTRMLAIWPIRPCTLQITMVRATPFTMGKTINTWPTLSDHPRLAKLLNFPASIDHSTILTLLARTGGKVSSFFLTNLKKIYSSSDKNSSWRRLPVAAVWFIWLPSAL